MLKAGAYLRSTLAAAPRREAFARRAHARFQSEVAALEALPTPRDAGGIDMKVATTLRLTFAALALCAWAGTAAAQVAGEPIGGFAGYTVHDLSTQTTHLQPNAPAALPVVVYDNTASPANFGFSSTDLGAVFGDQLATTGTGTLSEATFTLFNSGSSAGPVLTALIALDFYDANTAVYLGGFTVNLNMGGGLNPGFYTLASVTALEPLAIDLTTTDVVVLQTVTSFTGTATRLGIASLNPPTVGSSLDDMYIDASTVGAAGWYTIAAGPANPGYRVSAVSGPVPTEKSSWGRVKSLYR